MNKIYEIYIMPDKPEEQTSVPDKPEEQTTVFQTIGKMFQPKTPDQTGGKKKSSRKSKTARRKRKSAKRKNRKSRKSRK